MLGVEVIVQAAAEAVFWACTRARRLSCAAARLARQVRVICRVAAVSGVWRHRVHTTVTDLVTSSTATDASASQGRHQRCPVTGMTCIGEAMHSCAQRR
ncbi:hypothetical protein [Saccharopolyspora spinosa]|uniref:hypothetical protein n=1 Tax=Saccharopolyspora spinosa TaxID=60894 RepID=UPI00376F172C